MQHGATDDDDGQRKRFSPRVVVRKFSSSCRESVKRTSEPKPHKNHRFLVPFRIRSSQKSQPQNAANFGFGTLARWLSLAAAPTFAIMALLTGVADNQANMLCAAAQAMSPLNGMAAMYVLMSAFHLAPWLKLVSGRAAGFFQTDGRTAFSDRARNNPALRWSMSRPRAGRRRRR